MIRIGHIHAHVIELRDGEIELMLPACAAVFAAPQAAIVARVHDVGILGIDPHVVEVAVGGAGNYAETLAAIHAQQKRAIRFEDFVWVLRIDNQIAEVKRAPDHEAAGIKALPVFAAIIGAEQGALF